MSFSMRDEHACAPARARTHTHAPHATHAHLCTQASTAQTTMKKTNEKTPEARPSPKPVPETVTKSPPPTTPIDGSTVSTLGAAYEKSVSSPCVDHEAHEPLAHKRTGSLEPTPCGTVHSICVSLTLRVTSHCALPMYMTASAAHRLAPDMVNTVPGALAFPGDMDMSLPVPTIC